MIGAATTVGDVGMTSPIAPIAPPMGLPDLAMPGTTGTISMPMDAAFVPSMMPPQIPEAATAMPEINVKRAKPKQQTWQTKLAPGVIPPQSNFNYHRVALPEAIYAAEYSKANSHLPLRVTRQDYEAMLFNEVAQNNIDGTRALLNAGTGLQITNNYGETPLAVAKRSGATEAAQLLTARGAR